MGFRTNFRKFRLYVPIITMALITGAMVLGPMIAEEVLAPAGRRN